MISSCFTEIIRHKHLTLRLENPQYSIMNSSPNGLVLTVPEFTNYDYLSVQREEPEGSEIYDHYYTTESQLEGAESTDQKQEKPPKPGILGNEARLLRTEHLAEVSHHELTNKLPKIEAEIRIDRRNFIRKNRLTLVGGIVGFVLLLVIIGIVSNVSNSGRIHMQSSAVYESCQVRSPDLNLSTSTDFMILLLGGSGGLWPDGFRILSYFSSRIRVPADCGLVRSGNGWRRMDHDSKKRSIRKSGRFL